MSESTDKLKALFLCSANSCRSQMAEAFLRQQAGDRVAAYSAGLEPAEQTHPLARQVMEEVGLELSSQHPKGVGAYLGREAFGYVIIVCADTAGRCPTAWPGVQERLVWPFEDPVEFEGDEEAKLARFREVRDQIKEKISAWVAESGLI
jgi:arsenate reductase